MQELTFKNYFIALSLIISGIIASSAITLIGDISIDAPMPLLILGSFAAFLVCCFIFYPKATTGQTVQISILGILFNAFILLGVYLFNNYLNFFSISLKPEFVLSLNPLILGIGFLFSLTAIRISTKIEEIQEEIQEEERKEEQQPGTSYATEPARIPQTPLEIHKIQNSEHNEEPEDTESLNVLEPMELDDQIIIEPDDKDKNFIPTNIRLIQNSASKDTEQKGRIGSIGKLLVNNKDIENLIESEEILSTKTNVITTISGQKLYEKLNELKNEFSCMQEMALIDSGGFILANNFEDKQRVQIAGALISGAYFTLQNYFSQLDLNFPVRIFFETDKNNSFIAKTKNELLFSIWGKEDQNFQHIEYGPMTEILDTEDFSELDITPYADLIKIEAFAVSDIEGMLINSFGDTERAQLFAAISSAVFENLKVFLMNLRLTNLKKIVVFTPQKTITILKTRDKIVSFLTDAQEYPKVAEELLKIEEI